MPQSKIDKDERLPRTVARGIIGLCLLLAVIYMFVDPSVNKDKFTSETLYEAIHPYNWFFDTLGLISIFYFGLYVAGFAGKVVYSFTEQKSENSSGLVHAVFAVAALFVILMFIF